MKPCDGKVLLVTVKWHTRADFLESGVPGAAPLSTLASVTVLLLHTFPLLWLLVPSSPALCASVSESTKYTELHFLVPPHHSGGLLQGQCDFCPRLRERLVCPGAGNLWAGTFGSPPVSMQGYDGGGSLQFPLESFMWDRSEAKFFKYESARITLNFLKINGHSFISGRYRSSKSYSVFTETHFLWRAQNYCRHFCALSYTKKYVQSYRLVKKPREMVRWNPKLQRHREISGAMIYSNVDQGQSAGCSGAAMTAFAKSGVTRHPTPSPQTAHTRPKARVSEKSPKWLRKCLGSYHTNF